MYFTQKDIEYDTKHRLAQINAEVETRSEVGIVQIEPLPDNAVNSLARKPS